MLVIGYRGNTNFKKVAESIRKHTGKSAKDANKIVQKIQNGDVVQIEGPFTLLEDFEDNNLIVRT